MANSTDHDQTAPREQSDQGLYCLLLYLSKHLGSFEEKHKHINTTAQVLIKKINQIQAYTL